VDALLTGAPSYDSASSKSRALREVRELFRYRDLLRVLIGNINRTRYKRSALGIVWTLLNPLLNMIVLTIAFSQLFRLSIPHYPVFVLSGLIAWNFFSQTTSYSMNTLVWGGALIKRVYVPRSVFSVAAIGNGLINLGFALVPLVVIMVVTGHPVFPTWWFVPISCVVLAMFSLGVALLMSILAVFFVDVVEMYGVALQAWYFLTPIMYPKEILPAAVQRYLYLNPVYSIVEVFRVPVYEGRIPDSATIVAAVGTATAALLAGWLFFTWKADDIAYQI
jgi:ABC-type polysaccharide/polyol phosphate export permease